MISRPGREPLLDSLIFIRLNPMAYKQIVLVTITLNVTSFDTVINSTPLTRIIKIGVSVDCQK
jgi:hypothetical protein